MSRLKSQAASLRRKVESLPVPSPFSAWANWLHSVRREWKRIGDGQMEEEELRFLFAPPYPINPADEERYIRELGLSLSEEHGVQCDGRHCWAIITAVRLGIGDRSEVRPLWPDMSAPELPAQEQDENRDEHDLDEYPTELTHEDEGPPWLDALNFVIAVAAEKAGCSCPNG